jgi:D-alanyl-lipoteichoic acid acyltransferase DltB (MBOAT superfamily)
MLHQFHEEHKFEYNNVVYGLRLMLWGAFQKVVIADRAAIVVNMVYDKPANYSGLALILATVLFAFQILCDFAGYSNIAIGAARVMGFNLMKILIDHIVKTIQNLDKMAHLFPLGLEIMLISHLG